MRGVRGHRPDGLDQTLLPSRSRVPSKRCYPVDLSLLQLAEELGNISKVCKLMGYHRDTFYEVSGADGLPGTEGAFLACSFWLADNYALGGRIEDAQELFGRLLAVRNHLGLLAEEYDPKLRRQVGNFPQAFSHLALIATANVIDGATRPHEARPLVRDAGADAVR